MSILKFDKLKSAFLIAGVVISLGVVSIDNKATAMSFGADGPTLADIQMAIDKNHLDVAIKDLKAFIGENLKNADAWNLLGFSYRKAGQLDLSWDAYERALTIDPEHLGANEYLGELYIAQGNMEQAGTQLHKLMILCPSGCEAFDTLKAAIEKAE